MSLRNGNSCILNFLTSNVAYWTCIWNKRLHYQKTNDSCVLVPFNACLMSFLDVTCASDWINVVFLYSCQSTLTCSLSCNSSSVGYGHNWNITNCSLNQGRVLVHSVSYFPHSVLICVHIVRSSIASEWTILRPWFQNIKYWRSYNKNMFLSAVPKYRFK